MTLTSHTLSFLYPRHVWGVFHRFVSSPFLPPLWAVSFCKEMAAARLQAGSPLSRRSKLFEQLETAQVFYAKRINRLVMFASRKLQLKDVQCPVQVAQHGQCCHVSAMQDSRKSGLPTRLVPEEELLKVSHISPQSH